VAFALVRDGPCRPLLCRHSTSSVSELKTISARSRDASFRPARQEVGLTLEVLVPDAKQPFGDALRPADRSALSDHA
jgi:hypothetical protein